MAKDEAGRLNIVQGVLLKSTDFLRRIIAPAGGQGGVTLSNLCPHCNSFSLGRLRVTAVDGAQSVGKHMIGVHPTGCWWCKQVSRASQAKVFKAHAVPQDLCENLINALKLLANQQKDGDSPVQSVVAGLCERSRKGVTEPEKLY